MKDYDKVYKLIREHHTVNATPRLVAEFNHNRYSIPTATNSPLADADTDEPDIFNIASIVEGRRPAAGIMKARVDEALVSDDYEIAPAAVRYYVADPDDIYKYWCSPEESVGVNFPTWVSGTYPTKVNPQVVYAAPVKTNKIVIGLENSFSSPADYEVYVKTTVGGAWTKIKDVPTDTLTPNSDGQIILYWSGSTWTQTKSITSYTSLAGIQLRVNSMTVADTFFNLIELGLRLEWDMTSYLMTVSDTFDLGDISSLNPIGEASSNVGAATLFNHYEAGGFIFSNENTGSLFAGLMEENVKFTLDYIYDATPAGGSATAAIRQFEMYTTQHWSAQGLPSTTLSLRDSSKFLQETKCPAVFYEDRTVPGIIFRLLDSVGFDRYDIGQLGKQLIAGVWVDIEIATNTLTVPTFWANSEQMVWDALQELAVGTQTAIYFDAYDRLQVRTREQAFSELEGKVWTLRGNVSGVELTDVMDYDLEDTDISNDITVNYQTTEFEEFVSGIRRNTIVWQPEDEVVYVKSSDIQADLLIAGTQLKFTPADAALWPFEGMMFVDAEIIKYKGKQFTYYPSTSNDPAVVINSATVVWLNTYDDYKKYNFDSTPIKNRYLNKFSGYLQITERGVWNTPVQDHIVDTSSSWTQKNVRVATAYTDTSAYFKSKRRLATYKARLSAAKRKAGKNITKRERAKIRAASAAYKTFAALYNKYKNAAVTDGINQAAEKGSLLFKTNANFIQNHYLMCMQGNPITTAGYKYYGTRIRFNKDSALTDQQGGIAFQSAGDAPERGYYIELATKGGTGGLGRLVFYRRTSAGTNIVLASKSMIVLLDKWYTIDIMVSGSDASSTYNISAYIDGVRHFSKIVDGADKLPYYGRFGMEVHGKTNANFEYIYGVGNTNVDWPENFAYWDRINKGFASARFSKEFNFEVGNVKRRIKGKLITLQSRYGQFFFDEFGPIAHEIREFDIKYDTNGLPVLAPYVYFTNTGNIDILEVTSDAYGTKVYMVNCAREDAALQGTDDGHQFCVYGLLLNQRDTQKVTKKDLPSVAAVGSKELNIESKWIQNVTSAQSLADWMSGHWADATDTISVNIFGNPLIEVGDVVAMDIDVADIHEETHKYFVVSADSEFSEGGMSTHLILRRASN